MDVWVHLILVPGGGRIMDSHVGHSWTLWWLNCSTGHCLPHLHFLLKSATGRFMICSFLAHQGPGDLLRWPRPSSTFAHPIWLWHLKIIFSRYLDWVASSAGCSNRATSTMISLARGTITFLLCLSLEPPGTCRYFWRHRKLSRVRDLVLEH